MGITKRGGDAHSRIDDFDHADSSIESTFETRDAYFSGGSIANQAQMQSHTGITNEVISYQYDIFGNRAQVVKPEQNSQTFTYDARNRIAKVEDFLGHETRFEYDANNNLLRQYQPAANDSGDENLVEHAHDERNGNLDVITENKPGSAVELTDHDYDLLDRLEQETQRGHVVISHLKNACAWHLDRRQCSESSCITYTLRFLRAGGSQSACARLIFETASSYTYDNNGNRLTVTSPGGTTTNTFDTRNRLETVTTHSGTTVYTYLPTGWTDVVTHGNGTKVDYDYDSVGRTLKITNRAANNSVLSQFDYEYDLNGNRTQQIEIQNGFANAAERPRSTDYVYDDLDRLESFTHTQGTSTESHSYTYYPSYDRKTETVVKNGVTANNRTYTYDETYWVKTITEAAGTGGVITYTYDNNGNSLSKTSTVAEGPASTVFTYNSRNQLKTFAAGNAGSEINKGTYHYNYDGMRIRHLGSERGNIEYVYDDKSIIDELSNNTTTQVAHYSYGDRLLSLKTGSTEQFYHYAALGTTANLTNTSGQNQIAYRVDPFGEITQQEGSSLNRQVFTGHEHDTETGLIYMKARFYDPDIGRFINQDTYLGESSTPPSLHRYLYAYGNPTINIDPDGYAVCEVNGVYTDKCGANDKVLIKDSGRSTKNDVETAVLTEEDEAAIEKRKRKSSANSVAHWRHHCGGFNCDYVNLSPEITTEERNLSSDEWAKTPGQVRLQIAHERGNEVAAYAQSALLVVTPPSNAEEVGYATVAGVGGYFVYKLGSKFYKVFKSSETDFQSAASYTKLSKGARPESSAARTSAQWQGENPYWGVDELTDTGLARGDQVVQLTYRRDGVTTSSYFTTIESLQRAQMGGGKIDANILNQGMQTYPGNRSDFKLYAQIFKVGDDIPLRGAARGDTTANPYFNPSQVSSLEQIFILDEFKDYLRPTTLIKLDNTKTPQYLPMDQITNNMLRIDTQ